ncbi:MAG TPA: 6-bladed beta-propeller [Gemmatimonadaceae bacterium]|nr:6-bladed beta-propeller [Gemmatimonadaceae bacterium]
MLRHSCCVLGPVVAMLAAACVGGRAGEVQSTIRDSAGVEIVEIRATDADLPRWRLSAAPRLTIGTIEGEAAYQFAGIRGAMMHRERLLVIDGGSRELRFFDRSGKHLRSVGRRGGGPGEFEQPNWIGLHAGDSIAVYDGRLRRFTILDAAGTLRRVFTPGFRATGIVGRLADGSYIVNPIAVTVPRPDQRDGVRRDTIGIARMSADGERMDTLAIYPGLETVIADISVGDLAMIRESIRVFGLSTQVAAGDSSIYVGTTDSWAIDVLDADGRTRRSIRRAVERRPVTPGIIERYRAAELAATRTEAMRQRAENRFAELAYPEQLPAHGRLLVDADGFLWVQDYVVARDEPTEWTVFDLEGRMTGRVSMPPRFTAHQIGPDFVLGRGQDDLDVEYIVVYGLDRSGPGDIAAAPRPAPTGGGRQ